MIIIDKNPERLEPERFHIKSLRLWGLLKFFFVADLSVNPYTLVIESRKFGILKKYQQLDLQRIHRITPFLINNFAMLKIEADRGELHIANKKPEDFNYTHSYIGIWLPFLFYRDEAIAFAETLRNAIVKRELINRNYQRFNGN
jgi:hypothetical protein